ncbi:hypothetical protein [Gluconacetobacter johannae]|nr:hypothetical protein [Gluconacetobacter johannae]
MTVPLLNKGSRAPVLGSLFDQADKVGRDGFVGDRVEQHMEFSP